MKPMRQATAALNELWQSRQNVSNAGGTAKTLSRYASQLLKGFPFTWVVPKGTGKCNKREQTELFWCLVIVSRGQFLQADV